MQKTLAVFLNQRDGKHHTAICENYLDGKQTSLELKIFSKDIVLENIDLCDPTVAIFPLGTNTDAVFMIAGMISRGEITIDGVKTVVEMFGGEFLD